MHALATDQRRHHRITHSDTVQCVSGSTTILGRSVDLSCSGIQVTVTGSGADESLRSIALTLPRSRETIEVPCRVVRVESVDETGQKTLGIEFSPNAEAQLLLIERYIEESRDLVSAGLSSNLRRLPRAACRIDPVEINRESVRVHSISNISLDGLLLHFMGPLYPGELVELSFLLPGDRRRLSVAGRVTYVIPGAEPHSSSAGVRLQSLREVDRNRLMGFVVSSAAESAVRSLHQNFAVAAVDPRYVLSGKDRILQLLTILRDGSAVINTLVEGCPRLLQLRVREIDEPHQSLELEGDAMTDPAAADGPLPVYCSFFLNGGSYYFRSEVLPHDRERLRFRFPQCMFRSEKRSYQRKPMEDGAVILLELGSGCSEVELCPARLVDISWHGFSCEIPEQIPGAGFLQPGMTIRYVVRESLGLDQQGIVRHLKRRRGREGEPVLNLGIEAGISSRSVETTRLSAEDWAPAREADAPAAGVSAPFTRSLPVCYHNRKGERIVALLDGVRMGEQAPVVIIPPAFGKKKEAMSPLAGTLLSTFAHHGKNVVVVRYDGVNRPGESHNQDCSPERGYEMLHYRLIQGLEDLESTVEWVFDNPYCSPEKVFLVTSSMSALDARRLLASSRGSRISAWVSLLGVPAAQSVYGNLLGGIDIIGNHKMGIPNGIGGVLGYLLDLDALAKDLVTYRYAYLTDARADMSKIHQPVLWIYGSYDAWLDGGEIRDIMGVTARGERQIVEIPTGHNLRTSHEATAAFKLVSAYLYNRAFAEDAASVEPDREEMMRVIARERERVFDARALSKQRYWQGYLLGNDKSSWGYDFYKNLPEFREFLDLESALVSPRSGDRIADLGCGTGLFLETLLCRLARAASPVQNLEIVAVDLVQEALDKARAKCEALVESFASLRQVRIRYLRRDLDPNPLIAVQRYVQNPELGYDFLRNKVDGLRNATIDLLVQKDCDALRQTMRGDSLDPKTRETLSRILYDGHLSAVLEFNRAARYVRRDLHSSDPFAGTSGNPVGAVSKEGHGEPKSRALKLETLNFGEAEPALTLPFANGEFTGVVGSLFISYLKNPELLFPELHRILAPGGRLLVSALKQDSDLSSIYTRFVAKMNRFELEETCFGSRDENLRAARAMLSEVAGLMSLEEDGLFTFHSEQELIAMFRSSGFVEVEAHYALGKPEQAIIVTGTRS